MSDLLALVEEYLAYRSFRSNKAKVKLAATSAWIERSAVRHASIALREARQHLHASACRDVAYWDAAYQITFEEYRLASAHNRFQEFNLQEISDTLDAAATARKLRLVCLMLSHRQVFRNEYRFGIYQALIGGLEGSPLLAIPAVALYYHACRFLSLPESEDDFSRFGDLLAASGNLFPESELRALYLLAINYGIRRHNETGNPLWSRATFERYREALTRGLLYEHGVLSRFAYDNIAGFAILLDELDWAAHFIEEQRSFIERKYREAAYHFNMARLAYRRKDHGLALSFLQKADYKDFLNSMQTRILQMKIYAESGSEALLESHIESIQQYVQRQRAAGYHRERFMALIRLMRALIRRNPFDDAQRTRLRKSILSEPLLSDADRGWLLERV